MSGCLKITPQNAVRWRSWFLAGGTAALEKAAARPGRTPTYTERRVKRVMDMTLHDRPANAARGPTRTMTVAAGISKTSARQTSARRIRRAHGYRDLRLHRPSQRESRTFYLHLQSCRHAGKGQA